MKKFKLLFSIASLFMFLVLSNNVFALSSNALIRVGAGTSYDFTLYKTSTINDIISKLGEPKLITESAFGGYAYSFYTDDNYSNYLYVETTLENEIISYGSVNAFESNTYSYGDEYQYYDNIQLHGKIVAYDDIVGAAVMYNKTSLYGGTVQAITNYYTTTYEKNKSKYLKGVVQHGIIMYNAISRAMGKPADLVFSEDMFYVNEQMKEFGTSIREYVRAVGKSTQYMRGLGTFANQNLVSKGNYYVFNPLVFGELATENINVNFGTKTVAIFDFDYDRNILSAVTIDPTVFDTVNSVAYTDKEQSLLSSGRYEYQEAVAKLNQESGLYTTEPVVPNSSTSAAGIVAGRLKDSKREGIVQYLNAIRVAAGLPKVKADDGCFETAQHISTFMSYRKLQLGLDIQHQPSKVNGMDDSYYKTAVGWGKGYAENLGYSVGSSTVSQMMKHINMFIDDTSETPMVFSHRQKMISAYFTKFGYGISPYMFANEFTGSRSSNIYLEAWPAADGVTFMESLTDRKFYWTAQFTDKYTIQSNTNVRITCLNTEDSWLFTDEMNTSTKRFHRVRDSISSLNNKLIMYDSAIMPYAGYVYEVTLFNIKENSTGNIVDYTYRAVFDYADVNNYPSKLQSITLAMEDETLVKDDEENFYHIPVGEDIKVKAILDSNAVDKKITWISSDPDCVRVSQNGTLHANYLSDEDITITVVYDGSTSMDQIKVRPYNKIESVGLNMSEISGLELADAEDKEKGVGLFVQTYPAEATEKSKITWKISSLSQPGVEYDVNSSPFNNYVRVEVDPNRPDHCTVYTLGSEENNNVYIIRAVVTGLIGKHDGSCRVSVYVPFNKVSISALGGLSITYLAREMEINTDNYKSEYFNLIGTFEPKTATEPKTIKWTVGDERLIENTDGNGTFKILKEGKTTIKAEPLESTKNSVSDTISVNIRVPIKSLSLISNNYSGNNTAGVGASDTVILYRNPTSDTDKITYDLNGSTANAKVIDNGNDTYTIKFTEPGKVVLNVKSTENSSVTSRIEYNVIQKIDNIEFNETDKIVKVGDYIVETAKTLPLNNSYKYQVRYESANTGIATVDANGNVKGIGIGLTQIYAYVPAQYTTSGKEIRKVYNVSVYNPVTNVQFKNTSMTLIQGVTVIPEIVVTPTPTSDMVGYKWYTANKDYLEVNEKTGEVKALKLTNDLTNGTAFVYCNVTAGSHIYNLKMPVKVVDYLKGDMDRNGVVNVIDAGIVLDKFKSGEISELDMAIGDMNEDGNLDVIDAGMILDVFKALITFN